MAARSSSTVGVAATRRHQACLADPFRRPSLAARRVLRLSDVDPIHCSGGVHRLAFAGSGRRRARSGVGGFPGSGHGSSNRIAHRDGQCRNSSQTERRGLSRHRGTGHRPTMDGGRFNRDLRPLPPGRFAARGCRTPLPSPTLRSMDRDAGELRYPHSTLGHLRQLGIEVVEFRTYEAEEDS